MHRRRRCSCRGCPPAPTRCTRPVRPFQSLISIVRGQARRKTKEPDPPTLHPIEPYTGHRGCARPNRAASGGADRRASALLDDRLDRGKASAGRQRMAGISASRRKNWPKGSSTVSLSPAPIVASRFQKNDRRARGGCAARRRRCLRRVGHREVSPVAVGHQHLQILPGLKFRAHAIGKAQGEEANIGRRPGDPIDGCGQGLAQRRRALLDALQGDRPRPSAAAPGTSARRRSCPPPAAANLHFARHQASLRRCGRRLCGRNRGWRGRRVPPRPGSSRRRRTRKLHPGRRRGPRSSWSAPRPASQRQRQQGVEPRAVAHDDALDELGRGALQ